MPTNEFPTKTKPALPLPDIPAFFLFWVLALVVFVQFFTRYVLNDSLSWTEEIARYVLITLTFIGSVTVVRKSAHIKMVFFYRFLSVAMVKGVAGVIHLASAGFYAYICWISIKFIGRTGHQMMVSMDIPKQVFFWPIAVSFGLMAALEVLCAFRLMKQNDAQVRQIFEA